MIRHAAIFTLLLLTTLPANAGVHLEKDGVKLSVAAIANRAVFCISASGDLKVSSEYGVEFKVDRRNGRYWSEALPKVVTGAPYYFDLPLRIELKTRGKALERPITVNLGACSSASNACVPIVFEVIVPRASQDEAVSACSASDAIRPPPAR